MTLQAEVEKINWFHRINLGQGLITPGVDDSPKKLARLKMPLSLEGKTVLDIGAWDGFFAFEAERRGAKRVLAVDSFAWQGRHPGCSKAGFDFVRAALGSTVESAWIEVEDLDPVKIGTFDLVLFLGVLYHLRHPLLALEKVSGVAGDHLIVETHVDRIDDPEPVLCFYPDWLRPYPQGEMPWGPSPSAVIEMLKAVGFSQVEQKGVYPHTPGSSHGRMIVHAWKER